MTEEAHGRYIYVVAHLNTPDEAVYKCAEGEAVRIGRRPVDQGREEGVLRLALPFPEVSGYHADITVEGDDWFITDLGSMNGTWVSGYSCQKGVKRKIGTYDEIRIAQYQIYVFPESSDRMPKWGGVAFDEKANQFEAHVRISASPTFSTPPIEDILQRSPVYSTANPCPEETPRIDTTMHGPTFDDSQEGE